MLCLLSAQLSEIICVHVRRGPAGISPQSAAVYADATRDPTESELAANDSSADSPEQSATTPGLSCILIVNVPCSRPS